MNLAGSRVMLIGGAGLVGSHIVDQLINEPVAEIVVYDNFVRGTRDNLAAASKSSKVRIVDGSMLDRDRLRQELKGIDGVFLLASLWLGECVNDPRSAWEVNTLGTWNVVEACLEAGVGAFVQPGGSIRDAEVVAAADRAGATMLMTGVRHFRH